MDNWTMIVVQNWQDVSMDWCRDYLEGEICCIGNYWYFEKAEDITLFSLRWS